MMNDNRSFSFSKTIIIISDKNKRRKSARERERETKNNKSNNCTLSLSFPIFWWRYSNMRKTLFVIRSYDFIIISECRKWPTNWTIENDCCLFFVKIETKNWYFWWSNQLKKREKATCHVFFWLLWHSTDVLTT